VRSRERALLGDEPERAVLLERGDTSFTECSCQNFSSASLASFSILLCSSTLMMPMYQEPTDMIMSMISVPLATKSPCRQSASMP